MERMNNDYISLFDYLGKCRDNNFVNSVMNRVLTTVCTYLQPNQIVHGDLHFGNIFVHASSLMFLDSDSSPVQFIDFGRTVFLNSLRLSESDRRHLLSMDVMALVRAASRICAHGKKSDPHFERRHSQVNIVMSVVKTFLASAGDLLIPVDTLKALVVDRSQTRSSRSLVDSPRSRSSTVACNLCGQIYEWTDALLKHRMFVADNGDKVAFLDITSGGCTMTPA